MSAFVEKLGFFFLRAREKARLFLLDPPSSGLPARSNVRTLADGGVLAAARPTPAASGQSRTQPRGGFLGHAHLTQSSGRQVGLKHTAGAIRKRMQGHRVISTHADRLRGDQEGR